MMAYNFSPQKPSDAPRYMNCQCDLCSLKNYKEMEQVYKGITPPFLTNWPIPPGQPVSEPPRYFLPKPSHHPSGFAYDHDDLPKLVAVHSLQSSPHVIDQLRLASVHPMQPVIVGAPPPSQVTNISNINITVNAMETGTQDWKSMSPPTPFKNLDNSTPNKKSTKSSAITVEPNKDLKTLLNTIKHTILKVQELRTSFHTEPKEQIKRRVLEQLLTEREKLRVMQELMKGSQNEKNTVYGNVNNTAPSVASRMSTATTEAVMFSENSVIDNVKTSSSQMFEVLKSTNSKETVKGAQTDNIKASPTEHCLDDYEDQYVDSNHFASDDEVRSITCPSEHLKPSDCDSFNNGTETNEEHVKQESDVESDCEHLKQESVMKSDCGVANLDEQDDEEKPAVTKYIRCAGIQEERHEGDNFIFNEWTMDLNKDTHKAVFKRQRKTSLDLPLEVKTNLDEPAEFYQPPEKKISKEYGVKLKLYSQGELSSCDEESDVDIFRLETPRDNLQTVVTITAESTCDDDDEEAEEILKLGRQLQFREAKITELNQKKEKLMEELRRIKIKCRDS